MATKPENEQGKQAPAVEKAEQHVAVYDSDASAPAAEGERNGSKNASRLLSHLADRLGLSEEKLREELRLPSKAAQVAPAKPASSVEEDRIQRIEQVLASALLVFDGSDLATGWIVQRNQALGGVSPLSLLDTESGYQLVLDALGRIEYGVIS